MKRLFLLIAVMIFALPASSQVLSNAIPKVRLGVKVGANYQSNNFIGERGNILSDIKPGTGVIAGLQADLKWNKFGIHPELLYSYLALESEVSNAIVSSDVKVSKIDLPILLEYELFGFLNIQAGPTFALYTATGGECSVWKDAKEAFTAKWDFKRPPVGVVVGGDFRVWKFNFAVRYYNYLGKGSFTGVVNGESKMHGVQATLGFYL